MTDLLMARNNFRTVEVNAYTFFEDFDFESLRFKKEISNFKKAHKTTLASIQTSRKAKIANHYKPRILRAKGKRPLFRVQS